MDAHDSDVCANVVGKSLEAVRLLSNLGSGNAPDSAYVLAAYDQLTTAAYLLHQIIPWTKEENSEQTWLLLPYRRIRWVRLCVRQVVLASSFAAVAPVRVAWRMVPWREGGSHGLFDLAVRPVFRWLHDSNGHAGLE